MKFKQIFYHYKKLEEHEHGLWRKVHGLERKKLLREAIEFTGDAKRYGSYMLKVIDEWPRSCEHNLTCGSLNRQAWVGHAACCLAINCPEDITREAWHCLTQQQQDKANLQADRAIEKWETKYASLLILNNQLSLFSSTQYV